ncbi:magnesium chelatase domain-containing protein [Streptomyces sp. NBC_01483]|uniref:magnesium chelatase domain-containing protein n=1 Tax=Streptomyces sp. NBC_01483 TaxID=2903883 RepID=UPI002E35A858|nr:magnesium chelatase domain-containing protein [Streptomyces sp. NBC_01483]
MAAFSPSTTPRSPETVTLNGSGYPGSAVDLAIACAIPAAAGHVNPRALKRTLLIGELGLDGRVRDPRVSIRYADICGGYKRVIVASSAAVTCPVVASGSLHAAVDLRQALEVLALPLN